MSHTQQAEFFFAVDDIVNLMLVFILV